MFSDIFDDKIYHHKIVAMVTMSNSSPISSVSARLLIFVQVSESQSVNNMLFGLDELEQCTPE